MKTEFKAGQKVRYTSYGEEKTAIIVRVGSGVLFLDNKRWMHMESCTVVEAEVAS